MCRARPSQCGICLENIESHHHTVTHIGSFPVSLTDCTNGCFRAWHARCLEEWLSQPAIGEGEVRKCPTCGAALEEIPQQENDRREGEVALRDLLRLLLLGDGNHGLIGGIMFVPSTEKYGGFDANSRLSDTGSEEGPA